MSWSSGKDSADALHTARLELGVDVVGLLACVNADACRVAMHHVRRTSLEAQAERLGLPLHVAELPLRRRHGALSLDRTKAREPSGADALRSRRCGGAGRCRRRTGAP